MPHIFIVFGAKSMVSLRIPSDNLEMVADGSRTNGAVPVYMFANQLHGEKRLSIMITLGSMLLRPKPHDTDGREMISSESSRPDVYLL